MHMELANILNDNKLITEKDWIKHINNLKKDKQKLNFKQEFIKNRRNKIKIKTAYIIKQFLFL